MARTCVLRVGVAYVIMIIDNIVMQRQRAHKRQEDSETETEGEAERDRQTDRPSDGSLTIADPFRAAAQARQLTKLSVYCIELIITYTYTYLHALWARRPTTTTTCGATLRGASSAKEKKRETECALLSL